MSKKSQEILKYFELNKNENSSYQMLWDTVKKVIREKIIVINVYIWKCVWYFQHMSMFAIDIFDMCIFTTQLTGHKAISPSKVK